MSKNWFEKKKTFKKVEKTYQAFSAPLAEQPLQALKDEPATTVNWELKLRELQTFAVQGILSGADGGTGNAQHDAAVLGIMSELGQFAKEMRLKPREDLKANLARKRLGAIMVCCAELAILHGLTLDSCVVEKINDLCASDNRYDRPSSLT